MSGKSFIPTREDAFNVWQNNLIEYVSSRIAEWNIPAGAFSDLQVPKIRWENSYALAINPETRTKASVQTKNEDKKVYTGQLRTFIKAYITYNPVVTVADRNNMNLPVPTASRSTVPPPASYPVFTVDSSVIRRLGLHFRDTGGSSRAKPHGVHGAAIKWGISDTPPAGPDSLINSSFDTRTPLILEFDEANRGKTVYFCLRWENAKGEKGPWSEMAGAIIP